MKDYRKYYTPVSIAEFLLNDYVLLNNCEAIDICCGSSNLLKAANKVNDNIKLTGVDLSIKYIDKALNCEYVENDGRKFAIDSYNTNKTYNLVLANPPFELDKSISFFDELRKCNSVFDGVKYINLLTEMILANLLLLRENGDLLIIVPSSVLFGNRFSSLRELLLDHYSINKIWSLPDYIFQGNEIDTYAIQIRKCKGKKLSSIVNEVCFIDDKLVVKNSREIDLNRFVHGTWQLSNKSNNIFKGNIEIIRGNISSNQFTEEGIEVLHVAKKNSHKNWRPKQRVFQPVLGKMYNQVKNGDIIVSRIGRDSGEIYDYTGQGDYVSDCLLIIKGIEFIELESYLIDNYRCKNFSFLKKGTTSKYVSKKDILSLFV